MIKLTGYDKLLIICLILLGVAGLIILSQMKGETNTVVVLVSGEEVMRVPLDRDQTFSVDGPLGATDIEVKGRRVRVLDSPCTKKICVNTGWIDKAYQTIVCAPNRVVIRLTGGDNEIDGITG